MSIGSIIKEYRRKNSMSMQEFADKCELSKGYISMLEKGKHPQNNRDIVPSIETIQKISKAMGITIDELLGDVDTITVDISHDNSSSAVALSDPEQKLVDNYRQLNPEGQEKLIEYSEDLVSLGKYKKSDFAEVVEETA